MIDNINRFNEVLKKYKLVDETPSKVQEHIRMHKNREFRKALKKAGGYSVLTGLISAFFFLFKRLGINISFFGTAVVVGVSATAVTVALTAGIVTGVLKLHQTDHSVIQKKDVPAVTQGGAVSKTGKADEPAEVIARRFGVQPFIAENVSSRFALIISDEISKTLSGLAGSGHVINLRRGRRGKEIGMMVMGSVEKFDSEYVVNVRVTSVMTSRILFYSSASFKNKSEYKKACSTLSAKINQAFK